MIIQPVALKSDSFGSNLFRADVQVLVADTLPVPVGLFFEGEELSGGLILVHQGLVDLVVTAPVEELLLPHA